MYTYLEELSPKHITKNTVLFNVIGKIKNIHQDTTKNYTQFTLYNDNADIEWLCIIHTRLFNLSKYPVGTSVLIDAICLTRVDVGKHLLIQGITIPQLNLTGNKDADVLELLHKSKLIIDSQKFKKEFYNEIVEKYLELRDIYKAALIIGMKK